MSNPARKLLAVADETISAERERANVMEEALGESWSLIRELRAQLAAKDECIATLEEYAGDLTRAARERSAS